MKQNQTADQSLKQEPEKKGAPVLKLVTNGQLFLTN
jgi:hypothetical protein